MPTLRLTFRVVVQRSEDDGCHSEPEQRGGEESRRTENCTRDSPACGLRMTDPQNQCDGTVVGWGNDLINSVGAALRGRPAPGHPHRGAPTTLVGDSIESLTKIWVMTKSSTHPTKLTRQLCINKVLNAEKMPPKIKAKPTRIDFM